MQKLLLSLAVTTALSTPGWAQSLEIDELTFGFIKLTDMAPLAVAYEQGYFLDEGLFVTLEAQANWKVLLDGVIDGTLEGAHMLAGQPIAATIGYGTQANIVTPFSMDLNGNGITVSNEVWDMMRPHIPSRTDGLPEHPISAQALKPVIDDFAARGEPFNMGMVFPVSTHNYELRYWLASGGIHPGLYSPDNTTGQIDAQAFLSVTPPPQMPATLEAGTINGYCVGEPWNQQAVAMGIGVPVITDYEIWKNNPEKVFGMTESFVEENPNTTEAVVAPALPDKSAQLDWAAGASVMIRADTLRDIGLFDETFFLYFEETDLMQRGARAGWTCWYVPSAKVVHIGSVSTGMKEWQRMPAYWFASRRHYFIKNHGRAYAAAAWAARLTGAALHALRCRLTGRKPQDPAHFTRDLARFGLGLSPRAHTPPPRRTATEDTL